MFTIETKPNIHSSLVYGFFAQHSAYTISAGDLARKLSTRRQVVTKRNVHAAIASLENMGLVKRANIKFSKKTERKRHDGSPILFCHA